MNLLSNVFNPVENCEVRVCAQQIPKETARRVLKKHYIMTLGDEDVYKFMTSTLFVGEGSSRIIGWSEDIPKEDRTLEKMFPIKLKEFYQDGKTKSM